MQNTFQFFLVVWKSPLCEAESSRGREEEEEAVLEAEDTHYALLSNSAPKREAVGGGSLSGLKANTDSVS